MNYRRSVSVALAALLFALVLTAISVPAGPKPGSLEKYLVGKWR